MIELLVSIAIIGILSSIVIGGISNARADSRDKQRLASVEQARLAIEIYREAYGQYPDVGCSRSATQWTGHGSNFGNCDVYVDGVSNIIKLPTDPSNDVNGYIYRTNATGSEFKFMSYNAVESETLTASDEYARYPTGCSGSMSGGSAASYAVYSEGAKCW